MNSFFLFRLALLNTFKKRLRVTLAIVGIALTSSIIVILFGLQLGLRQLVDNEIRNGQAMDVVTVNRPNVQGITLNEEKISEIKSISGVSTVAESVGLFGAMTYHGISLNSPVYAVSSSYFSMSPVNTLKGTSENQPNGTSIILSKKALEVFSIDSNDAVGKTISGSVTLTGDYASKLKEDEYTQEKVDYIIAGVIDRGELPVFYVSIDGMKDNGLDRVSQVNVRLTNPDKMSEVRESIERLGFQTSSVQDTIVQINKLFEVIRNILLIFGIIVFILTVSATFTIITLTLMEETRQIGFLRIMGLRHSEVARLFIIQSIIITVLGAMLGCVGGILGGVILNGYASFLAESNSFSGTISVFVIPVGQVIMITTLSVIVGWVVGILPSRRVVRINPLEELLL